MLGIFALQIFINGLPEERIHRGVMLYRMVLWLRNPRSALVITSILFMVAHVSSFLAQSMGLPWWMAIGGALVTPWPQPNDLIWGYPYYRTLSIWPGVLWHASFVTLGTFFF